MRKHRFYLSITAVPALAGIALQQPAPTTAAGARSAAHVSAVHKAILSVDAAGARPAPPAGAGAFGSSVALTSFHASSALVADLAVADGPSVDTVMASTAALPYSGAAPPTVAVASAVVQAPRPPEPAPRPVEPASRPAEPASPEVWAELRRCESNGNYRDATGNGYYGAYQFSASTWHSLGYPGLPSQASPAVQDEAARRLEARSGWGQWPACSRRLGL